MYFVWFLKGAKADRGAGGLVCSASCSDFCQTRSCALARRLPRAPVNRDARGASAAGKLQRGEI